MAISNEYRPHETCMDKQLSNKPTFTFPMEIKLLKFFIILCRTFISPFNYHSKRNSCDVNWWQSPAWVEFVSSRNGKIWDFEWCFAGRFADALIFVDLACLFVSVSAAKWTLPIVHCSLIEFDLFSRASTPSGFTDSNHQKFVKIWTWIRCDLNKWTSLKLISAFNHTCAAIAYTSQYERRICFRFECRNINWSVRHTSQQFDRTTVQSG